jgi:curli biogenesis system outer membrane secretion channel CsgG
MFTTALIKSGAFRVLERDRLHEGVMLEKQINAQGMTTGDSAQHLLVGADYIFEGAITEANAEKSNTGLAGAFRGLGMEGSSANAEIGLDIRVVDARSGEVLDAVNVRKKVGKKGFSVGGVGSFVQSFTKKGLDGADVAVSHDRKEGVDKAFRACIEEAIYELVTRYGS